jgi:hypothetical protein
LNNFKQLGIALQNHHDTKKQLPMASTATWYDRSAGVGTPATYASIGTAGATFTAGQDGDGYSWIVQLLPFMEENVIWDKLNQTVNNPANARLGKLRDAAWATGVNGATQNPGTAPNATTNPYLYSTKINTLVCPSFPGEEDNSQFPNAPAGFKVGTGNYMALASTHFRATFTEGLESGLPTTGNAAGQNGGGGSTKNCQNTAYCGNGGLPFPGGTSPPARGLGLQGLSDGTSKTALITESREEIKSSWWSGLASYVVGAWPQNQAGNVPGGIQQSASSPIYWNCNGSCDLAINKGDTKGDQTKIYMFSPADPHGGVGADAAKRTWGPSSRHPGVVIHGFGDARSTTIEEGIDKNVYLWMITRNGREVSSRTGDFN